VHVHEAVLEHRLGDDAGAVGHRVQRREPSQLDAIQAALLPYRVFTGKQIRIGSL
jgi:hypothetical protein